MPIDLTRLGQPVASAAFAAIICATLIVLLKPLLVRYALARPNARSSHKVPTPQGGGIAVVTATLAVSALGLAATGALPAGLWTVLSAAVFLGVVGAFDDLRPIAVAPRLFLQLAAAVAMLAALPAELRIVEAAPWWLERALLLVGVLWFVNLTNFMDGLDWMTVAGIGPLLAALTIVGVCGGLPAQATIVAGALGGALLGFAPFNRPVARLFLGDVGSLPIGLLVAWLLITLASRHFAAALLLPLYYLADATVTLLRRLARGEQFWIAHRFHFYQRATDNGFPVLAVAGHVLALNILLCALAGTSIFLQSWRVDVALLALGAVAVAVVLVKFSRPRA
jgi:UDP-N-acetylmuramyl pentapeptide phosphotransferase/UDP-N-acetylglucosamine-1-phosphate transferase